MLTNDVITDSNRERLEKMKKGLEAWKEAGGVSPERMTPYEKARANPLSKALAIKGMCWECSGGQREEIKHCTSEKCSLYYVRPYQIKGEKDES